MREISLTQHDLAALSSEILNTGGSFCFKARGFSMYPFIRDGDIITVQPVNPLALKKGAVAFYRSKSNRLVAHRVISRKIYDGKVMYKMSGDALLHADEQIDSDQVLGQVVGLQRGSKVIRLDKGFRVWQFLYGKRRIPFVPLFLKLAIKVKQIMFSILI